MVDLDAEHGGSRWIMKVAQLLGSPARVVGIPDSVPWKPSRPGFPNKQPREAMLGDCNADEMPRPGFA
jgi:hypothetical protein